MRVLFCTNSTQKCGIANFGRLHYDSLIAADVDVTLWHADYPKYLPEDANEYDIVHINSHPLVLNHIQPQHLPNKPKISYLFHEVPNHWWEANEFPDVWHRADIRLTEEPIPGWEGDGKTFYWQMPVPDYIPIGGVSPLTGAITDDVLIGQTGIRGEGLDRLIPACRKNGWRLSKSGDWGWLSMEHELERLARCHLVASHMHSSYSGQSSSVLTAIASRRPVLLNSSRLLHQIWKCDQALAQELYRIEDIEEGVNAIISDIRAGVEKRPYQLAEKYSWKNQTKVLLNIWENLLGKERS